MHSSLRLENFSKLPRDLRKTATAAANGDIERLLDVYEIAQSTPLLEFLPILYAGLDGSPIPELVARLDSCSTPADVEFFNDKISRACLSMQCIIFLDKKGLIPVPASPDLWPRAWAWFSFIDTYRDHIPYLQMLEDQVVYYNAVLSITLLLRRDTATAAVIDATPFVRVIMVRIWALYLQDPEIAGKNKFGSLCGYIRNGLDLQEKRNLEEAIEGAGGISALAALALKHIKCVVEFPETNNTVYSLRGVVAIVCQKLMTNTAFNEALIRQGVVKALTTTLCLLTRPHFSEDMDCFDTCLFTIIRYIKIGAGHSLVMEALRAGLLSAFFYRARQTCSPAALKMLESILIIWTGSVVYLSVLVQLQTSIGQLKFKVGTKTFTGFPISTAWEPFWWILDQRLKVMSAYLNNEKPGPSLRACDNLACGTIHAKPDFRRCSGCLTSLYCSTECQAADWKEGDHRSACAALLLLHQDEPKGVSSKDKSFLRFLIHADYLDHKQNIFIQEVQFLRATSLGALPCVRFDYSRPFIACDVDVGPVSGLDAKWADYVSRAGRSKGRMRIHVMKVTDGGYTREWMIPLRHATEATSFGVQLLAMNGTVVGREISARVQTLMESLNKMKNIVEIH